MEMFVKILEQLIKLGAGLYQNVFVEPLLYIPPFKLGLPSIFGFQALEFGGINLTIFNMLTYGFISFIIVYGIIKFIVGIVTGS